MKKQFCILFAMLFCLSAFGCGSKGESDGPILFTVDPDSVTPEGLTYRIEGTPDAEGWMFGEDFVLEQQAQGGWTAVPLLDPDMNYAFNAVGIPVFPGQSREYELGWTWLYGALPAGQYRLGKGFSGPGEKPFTLWVEFGIPEE